MTLEKSATSNECSGKKLILRVDGAARGNPGPAGIGGVITNEEGTCLRRVSEYIGEATNNVAEYSALIFCLQLLPPDEAAELVIYSDSELLVRQLNGSYKVKNENLKTYFARAKSLLAAFGSVRITHVAREKNAEADKLANEGIDKHLKGKKEETVLDEIPEQGQLF